MSINQRNEENTTAKKKAIVIGVSEYSTSLQPLNFCKNDGKEMSELLTSLGYEILDNHRLIGYVGFQEMREAIYDFFDNSCIWAMKPFFSTFRVTVYLHLMETCALHPLK